MTRIRRPVRWRAVVLSVFSVLLFVAGAVLASGVSVSFEAVRGGSPGSASLGTSATATPAANGSSSWLVDPPTGTYVLCSVNAVLHMVSVDPLCSVNDVTAWKVWAAQVEIDTMKNLLTMMGNSFNETAAEVADLNATVQELLSYYEDRAEAIVPYFLNVSWNASTIDQIAIDSGLVPAIEGMALAYGYQLYQDWNSTVVSWNNLFGYSGTYASTGYPSGTGLNENLTTFEHGMGSGVPLMQDGRSYTVSVPYEVWNGTNGSFFFNLASGGTIICANLTAGYTTASCPSYKVIDYTKGTSFAVPDVSINNFSQNHNIPSVSTINNVGQFDLLKLVCESSCGSKIGDVEAVGAYAFLNVSSTNPDYLSPPPSYTTTFGENTMVYRMFINDVYGNQSFDDGDGGWVPTLDYTLCGMVNSNFVGAACDTGSIDPSGNTTALGSGPAAVPATNDSLLRYAPTFQSLFRNTMNDSEVYYVTLRTMTDSGTYAIPADCSIPAPSAGLPSSEQPADYRLSLWNGLATYWSYLNSVGKAFDNQTIYGLQFCGDPHLEIGFNWSASWYLRLNITASVYTAGPAGVPVYPNGTYDPSEVYANPSTWPIKNVDPTLLFPYEYQENIQVGHVTPIPINNPLAAVEVNWAGNPYYGENLSGQYWGIPAYLQLRGEGNFDYANGTLSGYSGGNPADGDAVYISSCLLNNVSQSTCDLAVVYFDAFVYGHENGLVGPPPPPGGGGGGGGLGNTNDCGFGVLNQFYDSWAGYIGSAIGNGAAHLADGVSGIPIIGGGLSFIIKGIGCILAWIVVVLIVVLFIYIAGRILMSVYHGVFGNRRGKAGGNARVDINVH